MRNGWSGAGTPALAGYGFVPALRQYSNVTTTGTSGNYYATVSSGWSGTVTPVLGGYSFSPTTRPYSSVSSSLSDQDFTAFLSNVNITGTVTEGGSGLDNVVLSGLPGDPVTVGSGDYSGSVAGGWSGTVTPILAGFLFSPVNRAYSFVALDQTGQDYTASSGYIISGNVANGGGIANVVMNFLPGNPLTDGSGDYSVTVSPGWAGASVPGTCRLQFYSIQHPIFQCDIRPDSGLYSNPGQHGDFHLRDCDQRRIRAFRSRYDRIFRHSDIRCLR